MKPQLTVSKVFENLSQIKQAMQALTEQDVYIGIPEDKNARKEHEQTGISNAYLGYIHEHGAPEKNIPARPHLIPGILEVQKNTIKILKNIAKQALEGKVSAVESGLKQIGFDALKAVQTRFVNNDWPELATSTLDARKKVSESINKKGKIVKKYGKSRRERGRINPLIDSNQLRQAYIYVIRKKTNTGLVVK